MSIVAQLKMLVIGDPRQGSRRLVPIIANRPHAASPA
jgi:hypothetical protein